MLDTQLPKAEDIKGLSAVELTALVAQMLAHIGEQSRHIDSQAQGIKWRDAKIEWLSRLRNIVAIGAPGPSLRRDRGPHPGEHRLGTG